MIKKCSLQYANDHRMTGPLYHGTTPENKATIERDGFQIFYGSERAGSISHGYIDQPYSGGIPPPIHHLGFGVYFTTVLAIAKQFNDGTTKNLTQYFIDTNRVGVINFGANTTMMKWWIKNGYDPRIAKVDRITATRLLTDNLKNQFDAVWYKGKGIGRLLDGDQFCVYYPDLIYQVDKSMSAPGDMGSKVIRKSDGMKGILLQRRSLAGVEHLHKGEKEFLTIKWAKGGTEYNAYPSQVNFVF